MPRLVVALLAVPLVVGACSSDGSPTVADGSPGSNPAQVSTIEVTLSDSGCEPRSIATPAGPTTFAVTNDGSAAVTEFEVLRDGRILGEVENVIPGADRSFSLTLTEGSYTTKCPGGSAFDSGNLEVADAVTGAVVDSAARNAAVQIYLAYVTSEADQLIAAVTPFTDAVRAGDVSGARNLFAAARVHYETIEPVAESFGALDPAIDAREGDVPEAEWSGFHRIEKALWVDSDVSAMGPVADRLVADVSRLRTEIDTVELEPAQIANGAVELLNEMSTSKITGEEDRYSRTDLSDFAANLAGSKAAFEALQPLLDSEQRDSEQKALSDEIELRFTAVKAAVDQHRVSGPTGNGYALYDTLTAEQTRALSVALDSLAEPLSRVAAEVL